MADINWQDLTHRAIRAHMMAEELEVSPEEYQVLKDELGRKEFETNFLNALLGEESPPVGLVPSIPIVISDGR